MRSTEDLVGSQFGKLTVTERVPAAQGIKLSWIAKCDCGNYVKKTRSDLQKMKSCGCHWKKPECVGERFGGLFVLSKNAAPPQGRTTYNLRCDCGNKIELKRSVFDSKEGTRSCGCQIARRKTKFHGNLDLAGEIFGELRVLQHLGAETECECSCGLVVWIKSRSIRDLKNRPRRGWLNCGDRIRHPDGIGLWYPPTPSPLPQDVANIICKYGKLVEQSGSYSGNELSGLRDEKMDRLIRAAWIITYRKSLGEVFTEAGEKRYIFKALKTAVSAVRGKNARVDKISRIGGRTAMLQGKNELTIEAVYNELSGFSIPRKTKKFKKR